MSKKSKCIFCGQEGVAWKPETIRHLDWCSHTLKTIERRNQYILMEVF